MLLTLASPNPYGYPECPAPQINQTLRWKMVFRVLGKKNCFSTKTFESLRSTYRQLVSVLFYRQHGKKKNFSTDESMQNSMQ